MDFDQSELRDVIGNFRTLSLFYETNITDLEPLYTLKDSDHTVGDKTYPSLKTIYLSFSDPTEWEFVQAVFGNWRHWERLCGNKKIREFIDQWREEMEIKLRSRAALSLINQSDTKDSAAKWVADAGWRGKRGRPSKAEVERERKIAAGIDTELADHWERVKGEMSGQIKPN